MHKSLNRQLQRTYSGDVPQTPEFQKLLILISETYESRDSEYELLERSLEISSKELTEVNDKLRQEKEVIEQVVKERTKELSQERSKLEKIAQNMETGAILLDHNSEIAFVNNTARKIISFKDLDLSGLLPQLYQTFASYSISEFVNRCLTGHDDELKDVETLQASYEFKFQTLSNETGYLIWIKDVTSEKLFERSKNELLAVASHQLRSPLTVVKGNTEMLLDKSFGPLTETQTEILQQVAQSNENMIRLVNQMLDSTKIGQGEVNVILEDVLVEEVLQQVVADLQLYADRYKITISNSPNKNSGLNIKADKTRLYQVFQNLIENAIKYSDIESGDGIVSISSEVQDKRIFIKIKDTGIGIPISEQPNLFKRFYRASNASELVPDGSGLGLYIVKSIIEHINGTIKFNSVERVGTTFIISFPIN